MPRNNFNIKSVRLIFWKPHLSGKSWENGETSAWSGHIVMEEKADPARPPGCSLSNSCQFAEPQSTVTVFPWALPAFAVPFAPFRKGILVALPIIALQLMSISSCAGDGNSIVQSPKWPLLLRKGGEALSRSLASLGLRYRLHLGWNLSYLLPSVSGKNARFFCFVFFRF